MVMLVSAGVVGSLVQGGVVGGGDVVGREGCVCGGVYVGVMVVLAGVVW